MPPPESKPTPDAQEIVLRTSSSAHSEWGDIASVQLPCRDWVPFEARYNDRWHTPMVGAEFKLWINDKLVLRKECLKDYKHVGLIPGKPPMSKDEIELSTQLGTFTYENCDQGIARAEIVRDPAMEAEIDDLRDAVHARLDGAYQNLKRHMQPFQLQWDQYGWYSLELSRTQGFAEGAGEWAEGLKELYSADYWFEVGHSIKSGFMWTLDTYDATVRGAEKLVEDAYAKRHLVLDAAWWQKQAHETVEATEEFRKSAKQLLAEGAEALEIAADAAQIIYRYRADILGLPDKIVAGDVDGIEEFIDTVLVKIDRETAEKLRYNSDWPGIIELLHDGEAAATFAVYLDLFLTVVPPNFWAHQVGKVGFYVLVEAVLIVIGALLGGAGAAARIGMLSARLARMSGKAAKLGEAIDKALDAFRAVQKMLDSFSDAIKDLEKLKAKLLKSRRRSTRRGVTRSTLQERREIEKRGGKCRVCDSTRHHTPLHRHGQVDYV